MRRHRPKITPQEAQQMLDEYEAFKAAGGQTTPTGGAHFMRGCSPTMQGKKVGDETVDAQAMRKRLQK